MTVNVPASITGSVEELGALDPVADWAQGLAGTIYPAGSVQRDLASGRLLGHPLHPLLTDVVIGSWLSAAFLDVLGGDSAARSARRLVGIGVLSALPTALAGLHDWMDLDGGDRRLGTAHALGNVTALGLFGASWLARAPGRRGGVLLSMLGLGVASASAWFGGDLAYRRGIGVNRTAFDTVPVKWQDVLDEGDLVEGKLVGASVGEVDIVLVRQGQTIHAMDDRCAHLGCALHKGKLEDGIVVCPCHGSAFALDGTVVRGPATADQPGLDTRLHGGKIQVRRRGGRR
jgi:nitrite reductase/ring-hydroxylating ferredoxin subunit/uncharacterized membrane protein